MDTSNYWDKSYLQVIVEVFPWYLNVFLEPHDIMAFIDE
jgi:hypothetical protein